MTDQIQKLTPLKKAMAKQMARSLEVPQFQLETEVDCTRLLEYKKNAGYNPSITTILTKLTANTLSHFPYVNSSWGGDCIVLHSEVNMGIAVDTSRGLLVPVIRNTETIPLRDIHTAMETIKEKRERGNFTLEELSGGTFTISNLGSNNITSFKAIVNTPEVGILAVSKMVEMPVFRNGQIVAARILKLCLSLDHRVVDGAYGSRFMTELAATIESL